MKKIAFIFVFLFWFSSSALAADHYFDATDGSDAGAGTSVDPWQTLAKVATDCTNGDICYFANDETWTGNQNMLNCVSGVTYDGTTWGGGVSGVSRALLDCTGGNAGSYPFANISIVHINASNVTFKGFEVDGNSPAVYRYGVAIGTYTTTADISNITVDNCYIHHAGHRGLYVGGEGVSNSPTISNVTISNTEISDTVAIGGAGGSGLLLYPAWDDEGAVFNRVDGVNITNCVIHDNDCQGIYIKDDVDNVVISGCTIYGNGGGAEAGHGIHFESHESQAETDVQAVTVKNCYIYNNVYSGFDFQIRFAAETIGPINIYNNIIADNVIGGAFGNEIRATAALGSSEINIYNNTIYGPDTGNVYANNAAVLFTAPTANVTIKNNIFYTVGDLALYDGNGTVVHSNNLFYRSSGVAGGVVYSNGTTYDRDGTGSDVVNWEATAQKTDPTFVTLGTDFSLQAGSPAINTGADLSSSFTTDRNGNTRPTGANTWDIGAYEYGSISDPTISNTLPSGAVSCTSNPRSVTLEITTNENSTCIYSPVDDGFSDMSNYNSGVTFSTTGGTGHSGVTTLSCGSSNIFYATCIDLSGNSNTSGTQIYFTINSEESGSQSSTIGGTGVIKSVAPSTVGSGVFRIQ